MSMFRRSYTVYEVFNKILLVHEVKTTLTNLFSESNVYRVIGELDKFRKYEDDHYVIYAVQREY